MVQNHRAVLICLALANFFSCFGKTKWHWIQSNFGFKKETFTTQCSWLVLEVAQCVYQRRGVVHAAFLDLRMNEWMNVFLVFYPLNYLKGYSNNHSECTRLGCFYVTAMLSWDCTEIDLSLSLQVRLNWGWGWVKI